MVIDKGVENFAQKMKYLRVGLLQLLCFEKLYKEEADKEDKETETINGKEHISCDKTESFQSKKCL